MVSVNRRTLNLEETVKTRERGEELDGMTAANQDDSQQGDLTSFPDPQQDNFTSEDMRKDEGIDFPYFLSSPSMIDNELDPDDLPDSSTIVNHAGKLYRFPHYRSHSLLTKPPHFLPTEEKQIRVVTIWGKERRPSTGRGTEKVLYNVTGRTPSDSFDTHYTIQYNQFKESLFSKIYNTSGQEALDKPLHFAGHRVEKKEKKKKK
jgi:hypothetical protein